MKNEECGQEGPLVFQHVVKELFPVLRGNCGQLRVIEEGGQAQLPVTAEGSGQDIFLIQHMPGDERQDGGGNRPRVYGINTVQPEEGVGFHHSAQGQIGNLAPVGNVDIGYHIAEAEQGFQQQVTFLPGTVQGDFLLSADEVIRHLQFFLQILLPPGNGGQAVFPFPDCFGIPCIPGRHELCQVPVPGSGNDPVTPEQVKLDPLGTAEVGIHPVVIPAFAVAAFRVLFRKPGIEGIEVRPLPGGAGQPGEVVNAGDCCIQVLPFYPVDLFPGFQHGAEQLLGAEDLMAAAEGPDRRKNLIEGAHTKGHGIGIVDHPGFRRVIPDGLPDPQPLRQMDV